MQPVKHAKYTKTNSRPAATEPQNSLCPLCLSGENNHGENSDVPDAAERTQAGHIRVFQALAPDFSNPGPDLDRQVCRNFSFTEAISWIKYNKAECITADLERSLTATGQKQWCFSALRRSWPPRTQALLLLTTAMPRLLRRSEIIGPFKTSPVPNRRKSNSLTGYVTPLMRSSLPN